MYLLSSVTNYFRNPLAVHFPGLQDETILRYVLLSLDLSNLSYSKPEEVKAAFFANKRVSNYFQEYCISLPYIDLDSNIMKQKRYQDSVLVAVKKRVSSDPTPTYVPLTEIFVAIQGSNALEHWLNNANIATTPHHMNDSFEARVHDGFKKALLQLPVAGIVELAQKYSQEGNVNVIFCGHSRGGALGSMAAIEAAELEKRRHALTGKEIQFYSISFGAPAFSCIGFGEFLSQQLPNVQFLSFSHEHDPVPTALQHFNKSFRHIGKHWTIADDKFEMVEAKNVTPKKEYSFSKVEDFIQIFSSVAKHHVLASYHKILHERHLKSGIAVSLESNCSHHYAKLNNNLIALKPKVRENRIQENSSYIYVCLEGEYSVRSLNEAVLLLNMSQDTKSTQIEVEVDKNSIHYRDKEHVVELKFKIPTDMTLESSTVILECANQFTTHRIPFFLSLINVLVCGMLGQGKTTFVGAIKAKYFNDVKGQQTSTGIDCTAKGCAETDQAYFGLFNFQDVPGLEADLDEQQRLTFMRKMIDERNPSMVLQVLRINQKLTTTDVKNMQFIIDWATDVGIPVWTIFTYCYQEEETVDTHYIKSIMGLSENKKNHSGLNFKTDNPQHYRVNSRKTPYVPVKGIDEVVNAIQDYFVKHPIPGIGKNKFYQRVQIWLLEAKPLMHIAFQTVSSSTTFYNVVADGGTVVLGAAGKKLINAIAP